jgi:predicted amidohydrolase YtcJ
LTLAKVDYKKNITGGEVITQNGVPTGLLIDNAVDLVTREIPPLSDQLFKDALLKAQENCLSVGLTTIDDCGLDGNTIEKIKKLQDEGSLQLRIYAMLSDHPDNYRYAEKNGMLISDLLTVRSFKVYGDGALGSRGACLLKPYHDQQDHYGFLLSNPMHFDSVANWCFTNGWQMNTHAIGDSGNRVILNTYAKYLSQQPNADLRWRIEHAQVVDPADLGLFGKHKIVPSVQPTHATSDMYWAEDRLGKERISTAYAFKKLLEQNRWIPLGTDFPVEDISPFKTFCAAVFRQDLKGWPTNGFQSENALSREEAIRGMTIWAARSNFEESKKGSLEKGKWADFVVVDTDLMKASVAECYQAKVFSTFINGKQLYHASK